MVLHLAVANNWGGGDSYRKATLLLDEVLKMFQPNPRAGLRPRRAPDQYVRGWVGHVIVGCGSVVWVGGFWGSTGTHLLHIRNHTKTIIKDVEDHLASYLDEQFETLVEDGSVEEVRACVWMDVYVDIYVFVGGGMYVYMYIYASTDRRRVNV